LLNKGGFMRSLFNEYVFANYLTVLMVVLLLLPALFMKGAIGSEPTMELQGRVFKFPVIQLENLPKVVPVKMQEFVPQEARCEFYRKFQTDAGGDRVCNMLTV